MITVKYRCVPCRTGWVELQVPARDDPDPSSVVPYVRRVVDLCGEHHRSIMGEHDVVIDLMLPAPPEAQFIGQQIE